jgi:hypothetical protein
MITFQEEICMTDRFTPILRFAALSDIHYKDQPTVERERFACALEKIYAYADSHARYRGVDAVAVIGDFADSGSETQMQAFKASLDKGLRPGTALFISVASHEFNLQNGGEPAALERLTRIFGTPPDVHKVMKGFHFISLSTTKGTRFDEAKQAWAAAALKKAAADDPRRPIFFFQHPHISGTVYGCRDWGEKELYPILMNHPQVVDFSGHSHCPVNDPRSIHQKHFTSLGTGTLSYFELDEFDKVYGTIPPGGEQAAQFLIVEADAAGRVRVYPYDLIAGQFFPMVHNIDTPWEPESFTYTDKRYETAETPRFAPGAAIKTQRITRDFCELEFPQAKLQNERVNDYLVTLRRVEDNLVARRLSVWSGYYFYHMPEVLRVALTELAPGTAYTVELVAGSFWGKKSEALRGAFATS